MDYRTQPVRRRNQILALCASIILIVTVWHRHSESSGAPDYPLIAVRTVTAPLAYVAVGITRWLSRQVDWIAHSRSLEHENQDLKTQNSALRLEAARLRESAAETTRLRAEMGLKPLGSAGWILADVLALQPDQEFRTLVVGRGTSSGVRRHSVVVTGAGLVGQVYDVGPTAAAVVMLTDPGSAVGAMVQRATSRDVGICHGTDGPLLEMDYLDPTADVHVGDVVVTSGLAGPRGVYPKGLVIGKVASVRSSPGTGARTYGVTPAVNLNRLEDVFILR